MTKLFQILLAVLLIGGSCIIKAPPAAAISCTDLKIIFARGSGEKLNDTSYQHWQSAITEQLATSKVSFSFYELGREKHGGAIYPAVAVAGSASGIGNLLGAYISAGSSFEFGRSVDAGRQELQAYIGEVSRACPQTKFVLGGYSQGAMLISGLLPALDSERIIYTATFGDPKLYLPEGKGNRPVACQGKNLSNYRAYVSDCHAYEGVLGSYRPYQTPAYHDKLGAWCNARDIMCSSGLNISDHTAYTERGLYRNAATTIRAKVRQTWPEKFDATEADETKQSSHDMAILLDVGGAMIFERLETYKAVARRLASRNFSLGGRVSLYYYSGLDKIRPIQKCDLSCTPEEFNRHLNQLTGLLSYGERFNSGLSALKTAMTELEWQVGATKSAVLLSAMPFDPGDKDGTNLNDVVQLSLEIDPVNVYPFDGSSTNPNSWVAELAKRTNGKVYTPTQVETAADEIIGRPTATLALEEYAGVVGDEFVFDTGYAADAGLKYEWDLDADGVFELQNSTPRITHRYQTPVTGFAQVKITDDQGYSSTMSARIEVKSTADPAPTVKIDQTSQIDKTTHHFELSGTAAKVIVIVDDTILGHLDLTQRHSITISDLSDTAKVRFVAVGAGSVRGEAVNYTIGKESDVSSSSSSNPDAATPKENTALQSGSTGFVPTAPNTGVPFSGN